MRAALQLEAVGDGSPGPRRAWVAEVSQDIDTGRLCRTYMRCQKDYRDGNSTGSRGVMVYYWLEEGKVYEVSSPATWRRSEHFFCRAENGEVVRMTLREAIQCLNAD